MPLKFTERDEFFSYYEIKEWNEDNFDVNAIPYTADAYKDGKYAFVSDYARFWVLFHYGGVYFDTDVEVIRSMYEIIEKGPFMGFELIRPDSWFAVAPGLGIAAEPGMPFYQEILHNYESLPFHLDNGGQNPYSMIPMVTEMLRERGLKGNGSIEHVAGMNVYPPDWFNPYDDATGRLKKTGNTYSIHWFAKSWLPKEPEWKVSAKRLLRRTIGTDTVLKIKGLIRKG